MMRTVASSPGGGKQEILSPAAAERLRAQMLRLVSKGFYDELFRYGVQRGEIVRVAAHLLDQLLGRGEESAVGTTSRRRLFTIADVEDAWESRRCLTVGEVSLRPMDEAVAALAVGWMQVPGVRDSFIPPFPEDPRELMAALLDPASIYLAILHRGQPVGFIGGTNIDREAGRLEMKKLVGEPGQQGRGIGKRATFAFLYHVFVSLGLNKVCVHSRDINIRNINLNSRFGFEVEGVLHEEFRVGDRREDIVRMAVRRSVWMNLFAGSPQERNASGGS